TIFAACAAFAGSRAAECMVTRLPSGGFGLAMSPSLPSVFGSTGVLLPVTLSSSIVRSPRSRYLARICKTLATISHTAEQNRASTPNRSASPAAVLRITVPIDPPQRDVTRTLLAERQSLAASGYAKRDQPGSGRCHGCRKAD